MVLTDATLPRTMAPMLATTSPLPQTEERWAWEPQWDGWRVLVRGEKGQLRAITRAGYDVTSLFPELEPLGAVLGRREAILDGELVAWGDDGRPDFGRLFSRFRGRSPRTASQARAGAPVTWVAFDVCYLDGVSFLDQPYRTRRAAEGEPRTSTGSGRARSTRPASRQPSIQRPRSSCSAAGRRLTL